MKNLLELIEKKINIVDFVIEKANLKLTKKGNNYVSLCPFHKEKKPSFYISPEKKIAKCFGCNKGGKAVTFLQEFKNISFKKALEETAIFCNIENFQWFFQKKEEEYDNILKKILSFYQNNLKNDEKAQDYLKNERQINQSTINFFKLGFASKKKKLIDFVKKENLNIEKLIELGLILKKDNKLIDYFFERIVIPIFNKKNKLISFFGRTIEKNNFLKYLTLKQNDFFKKRNEIFNINNIENEKIIIYEGFFDVFSSHQNGIKNCVCLMGNEISDFQCKKITSFEENIIIAFDNDESGIKNSKIVAKKIIPFLSENQKLKIINYKNEKNKDPDDFFKNNKNIIFQNILNEATIFNFQKKENINYNNQCFLQGRISKNLEIKEIKNIKYLTFGLIINDEKKNFINCIAFKEMALLLKKRCKKGQLININGQLLSTISNNAVFNRIKINNFYIIREENNYENY